MKVAYANVRVSLLSLKKSIVEEKTMMMIMNMTMMMIAIFQLSFLNRKSIKPLFLI